MAHQIAAEYYNIPAAVKRANPGRSGKLEIVRLENGRRELLTAFLVDDKAHARRLAQGYDAKPWNF